MIRQAIGKVVEGVDLEEEEMSDVMKAIMEGGGTPSQIAAFATALRMKGETVDEIIGAVKAMRRKAVQLPGLEVGPGEVILDTCGTGGDGAMTFNISTATAFVVAGGGVKVAKHGNRSVSSMCGSADVLEKLGINVQVSPDAVVRHIREIGIGFLFAPGFHGSMKHAATPRREIGIRTIFNVLGPLTNPAGARHQLLGVYRGDFCETLARVLLKLGTERAMVVHGLDGIDEISVTADTMVSEIRDGTITNYTISPSDYGFSWYKVSDLRGGDAAENAEILKAILSGEGRGAKRAVVLMNAGAAFCISGMCRDIKEGMAYAGKVIDSGKAMRKLEELAEASRK